MNEYINIKYINIDKIKSNSYQPRVYIDKKDLDNLSFSIKKYGFIKPLTLRKDNNDYELIDGEKRYRVAKKLYIKDVPSVVLDLSKEDAIILSLLENENSLTPLEEAKIYSKLLDKMTIKKLSSKLNTNEKDIKNKLELLKLTPLVEDSLLRKKISLGHAKILTKVPKEEQSLLLERILKERLTVKSLEEIVNKKEVSFNDLIKQEEEQESLKDKELENQDKVKLKELNKIDFLEEQEVKKNKKENKTMDNNNQFNFNQYNNLLKEQPKQEMYATSEPSAIIGNKVVEPSPSAFFPSLEEQPLNFEVPVENNTNNISTTVPEFSAPTVPSMSQPEVAPQQEMVQQPQISPLPEFSMPTSTVMPELTPQDSVSQPNPVPEFNIPPVPSMPQPEVVPQQEMVQQPQVSPLPEFSMPTSPVMPELTPQEPVPQPNPVPEFNIPAGPTMPQPEVAPQQEMIQQPQVSPLPEFSMPTSPVMPEPTPQEPVSQPNPIPEFNIPTGPINNEQSIQPAVKVDVIPAVNMIRNLIPLLENSGYKITLEEKDNANDYEMSIKILK